MERVNAWTGYSDKELKELEELALQYRHFLNEGKTERECAAQAAVLARQAGYRDLKDIVDKGEPLKCGDKVYSVHMKKTVALFQIGRRPLSDGMRILGAHIDSPRLDVKQNPLYEDSDLAYLDTHYYGGIKKYQWVTVPLAIHGVVAMKDGTVKNVRIGEEEDDPIFCVTDLLIHLASEQMDKRGRFVVEGEKLDLLVGSRPLAGEKNEQNGDGESPAKKDAVRKNILRILKEKYGIEEDDFLSAELEVVPAAKARDMGFDRSMVAAYGQDDKVCAYTSLAALLDTPVQEYTSCCLLTDKEEIGSVGATGAHSHFFENSVAEIMNAMGDYSEIGVRRALSRSKMLSSDVSAGYDPLYASRFDKKNSAYLGHGLVFNKYTGAAGKSGSNDCSAEYFAWVRAAMDKANVHFQTAELGAVDAGGGGTIAYITANYGMEVVDSGVAVLSMHAPLEVTSKADIYEAKKGYMAFLKA